MHKLILILVDGIGADFFLKNRHLMPHLNRLANEGLYVERLAPATCATSLPGRASMLTGVPSEQHGIYGNIIWGGSAFRYATPYDVKAQAITRQATDHGKQVASVGYGMSRKEDCHCFLRPFWVEAYMQDKFADQPASCGWRKTMESTEADFLLGDAAIKSTGSRLLNDHAPGSFELNGQINDQLLMDHIVELALSSHSSPDFILGEIAMPDFFFHKYGCNSEHGLWAAITADAMIGRLRAALEDAGEFQNWHLAIMSDHGHTDVDKAIHPEFVLPANTPFSCESSVLYVHYTSQKHLADINASLAEHGVSRLQEDFIPVTEHDHVAAFLAPGITVFEEDEACGGLPEGRSHYVSSHGFRFGYPGDDRFAIFSGNRFDPGQVARASAEQITPTMAALLGLPVAMYSGESLL